VAVQRVDAGGTYEGLRVINSGLEAGVPVIVDGLQMIQPGVAVKTTPAVIARGGHGEATKLPGERAADRTSVTQATLADSPRS
jgi:hypothetical protein